MSLTTKFQQLFAKTESANVLGIALSEQTLSYCYLEANKSAQFQQLPITHENFTEVLAVLAKNDQLTSQANIVLAPKQYQIVQVDKPNVPSEEIRDALVWHIKDLVSFSPDDMVLDYFDGPKLAGGSEKLNVVCAQKSVLKELVALLDDSHLSLKRISTEEFAFASMLPIQEQATLLVCQQPGEEINILIVKQGQLYFHRRLRGFAQIGEKNQEELGYGVIDSLSLEIQRSTDYFERQLKQAPIKDIQLLLPVKEQAFLVTKLAENTTTPVSLFNFPDDIADRQAYATAIGATRLADMEANHVN